jgi:thiol-disulfide isomerase/thioredoxin
VIATEDAELAGRIAPEVRDRMGKWTSNVTIFEYEMEFLAFCHFVLFLDADQKKDSEGAKKHLAEAFWNLPAYAKDFGQALEKRRAAERMATLRLDLDEEIQDCEGGKTSLRKFLGENKALLLDFWASWCKPCDAAMPALKKKSESLGTQGIVVVAMNTESDPEKAKKKREEHGMEKVPWMMDLEEESYSKRLEIEAIPCLVLVDREGGILFKGHPFLDREELAKSLQKIDPELQLPAVDEE